MSIAEKLTTITENQQKVYDAGKKDGIQSEYDRFWDEYQNNGNRESYYAAFCGTGWNDETFKPKYDIVPRNASNMFASSNITNLKSLLNDLGIKLDFQHTTNLMKLITNSSITELGELNFISLQAMNNTIDNAPNLHTIDLIKLPNAYVAEAAMAVQFSNCTALKNITFEGTLYYKVNLQWSPLSVESMKNIISCLCNYTDIPTTYEPILKFNDECWAALEANSTAPDGNTWREYVQNTLCWNI